jgi:Amidase
LTADSARKEADEADAALARGDIKGPLHGVPMTIKDTLETTGVICTGGTKGRANYVPKADATAVARLRAAGAIFLGKTNVPELAGAPKPTIWFMAAPTTPMISRARRAAAAAVKLRSFHPAARRWVLAPTPAAVFECPRIFAVLPRSSRLPAGCRVPGNFRSRWAPARRCFMSA